jgi:hypothetical protein
MIKQGKIYLRGRYLCGSCYVMFAGDMNILWLVPKRYS